MKNKKGFTLIELLSVIVVLGIISTITVMIVMNNIRTSNKKLSQTQKDQIIQAAKDWALKNPNELDKYHLNDTYVSIKKLKEEGFLENNKIINPETGKVMNGCVIAQYKEENKSYTFMYEDDCTTFENTTKKNPALMHILDKENANSNSTLYEENNYYVYKGDNPNNYLEIDNETWRIISIDKETLNLKAVLITYNVSKEWNTSTEPEDLTFSNSTLKEDLNKDNNILTNSIESYKIVNSTWNVGVFDEQDKSLESIRSKEKQSKIQADVGLISASEYIEASSNNNCSFDSSDNNCSNNNYLNLGNNPYWLINSSSNSLTKIEHGKICSETDNLKTLSIHPVIYLNYGLQLEGDGTSEMPYTIKENA